MKHCTPFLADIVHLFITRHSGIQTAPVCTRTCKCISARVLDVVYYPNNMCMPKKYPKTRKCII
jgi:hypothetical protein